MTSIVTRTGKGAPLSISELDANFVNLNTDKVEKTRIVGAASGELTVTNGGALNQDITLGLPNTGVSAGTLNNSATQTTPFTVDAKGRITGTSSPVTLAPDFANVANKPTTLAGYGITDAQPTITGAASTIDTEDLTASRALASDSSGKVVATTVTATELGYLANVTQNLQTQLDGKQGTSGKDQANGYAGLNASGKLSDAVLPDLAISDYLGEVADETAMLALTGQKGDWCTRTDVGTIYVITGNPASAGGWMQLSYPGTPVKSVAGKTGVVTLDKTDVGLSAVSNDAQLKIASNLSDLNNAATARTNLGLAIGTDVQAYDADLQAIGALTGTSGLLKKTAANTWALDTTAYTTNTGTVTSVGGTGTVSGLTLSGTVTSSGSLTLGGTLDLSSPPAIGGTTPAAGAFTTLSSTGNTTLGDASGDTLTINAGTTTFAQGTANGVLYLNGSKVATSGSALTFDGTNLTVSGAAYITGGVGGQGCYLLRNGGDGGGVYSSQTGSVQLAAPSTNPITFVTNSLERGRFTSKGLLVGYTDDSSLSSTGNAIFSGNVGIGTSAPGYKLDVRGSATTSAAAVFSAVSIPDTNGNRGGFGVVNASGGYLGGIAAQQIVGGNYPNSVGRLDVWVQNGAGTITAATLDSSGNLGLGVTPSAWNTKGFEIGYAGSALSAGAANDVNLSANAYSASSGWARPNTGVAATRYNQNGGIHYWQIAASGSNPIVWTNAMTLDASGNLIVGRTDNPWIARLVTSGSGQAAQLITTSTTALGLGVQVGSNGTGQDAISVYSAAAITNTFIVRSNGNVLNTNNSYAGISDFKLKENITDATPKLDDLLQVRVRNYNLKSNPKQKQIGVIAQELETIFPGMVDESTDRDANGNDLGTKTKSVKYSVFTPMLIKAIQELHAEIEQLKMRIH